ncbi:MAG: flagellar motor switch protein FliM [Planctomycetota bacterium]|jgi:flagellar motor switch protein FliM
MNEPLEQSDIDALVDAVEAEPAVAAPQIFSRCRRDFENIQIRDYDFKRPERISKEQIRALQNLHDTFARSLGASLSGFLRTIAEVRVTHVEQMTFAEFVGGLPNPTSFNLLSAPQLEGLIGLELSPLVVYPIIDRLLGGSSHELFIPPREMTTIESRLIQTVLERAASSLAEGWEDIRTVEFELDGMESNPQLVQIVPPNEVVIVVGFEIKMGAHAGTMSLCLPSTAIEPLLPLLSIQSWANPSRSGDHPRWERAIGGRLAAAAVPVVGVLARTRITMADLAALEPGDVITTDKPAAHPIVLEVSGQPKFLASIGQYKGRRALRVVRPIGPGDRIDEPVSRSEP